MKKNNFEFMDIALNRKNRDIGEIYLYGDVSDYDWDAVSPNNVKNSIEGLGDIKELCFHINSYGGSVVAGNAIVSIIDNYKRDTGAKITAYIEGIAASMASGIVMAADEVCMAQNALFMVHKPISVAIGNAEDMEREKEILDKVENTLVANYMRKFNGTEDELRQMMADETWLNAEEAMEYGFVDVITEPIEIVASAKGITINGKPFNETVKEAMNKLNVMNHDEDTVENNIQNHKTTVQKCGTSMNDEENDQYIVIDKKVMENLTGKLFVDEYDVMDYVKQSIAYQKGYKNYKRVFDLAVADAMKAGVRAKGDNFNATKWEKILRNMEYEDVIDQMNEWTADAKLALKAGVRVSVSEPVIKKEISDISDYQF